MAFSAKSTEQNATPRGEEIETPRPYDGGEFILTEGDSMIRVEVSQVLIDLPLHTHCKYRIIANELSTNTEHEQTYDVYVFQSSSPPMLDSFMIEFINLNNNSEYSITLELDNNPQ